MFLSELTDTDTKKPETAPMYTAYILSIKQKKEGVKLCNEGAGNRKGPPQVGAGLEARLDRIAL